MNRARPGGKLEEIIRPYAQEEVLCNTIPKMSGQRLLCTSLGLAQFAVAAARNLPGAAVTCTYFDLYRAGLVSNHWPALPPNLHIACAADLPDEEADVVALPISASGEAELTRELIQDGHERLRLNGKMYVATDNADDTWLRDELGKLFRKVERHTSPAGALYIGMKTGPLKRKRNFACEFAFRDRGHLIRAYSRPGVFSHRRVDPGARHLLNEMHIEPGFHVLDIGCGAGVVALAAACRADGVKVHAIDSNARAVQCTRRSAELNQLENVTTELNAAGGYAGAGSYELAVANPPYYSSFRIAEHFLTAGLDALRPGGTILVVTKHPGWYQQNMSQWYANVKIDERKGYYVVVGVRS